MSRLVLFYSVLAVVAQVVHAGSGFSFKLSNVSQCEPVQLTFSGSSANNHSVPTFLTVLPLIDNGLPIQIPIPNGATNTTAISLSFIPLPEGSRFIASLDNGVSSDVTKVGPSTAIPADTSCFTSTTPGGPTVSFYDVPDEVDQCEPFNVTFTTQTAPNITAFSPKGNSFNVALVNPNLGPNTAQYMMNGQRGSEIVLLLNDSANNAQTSSLLTIGGDSGSSKSCLQNGKNNPNNNNNKSQSKSKGLPKAAIIGIAVGAAVLVFGAMILLWYLLRLRRERRIPPSLLFDPARLNQRWPDDKQLHTRTDSQWSGSAAEKKADLFEPWQVRAGGDSSTPSSAHPTFRGGMAVDVEAGRARGEYVLDPAYTNDAYRTSMMTDEESDDGRDGDGASVRTSISSWNQFVPVDQRGPGSAPAPASSSSATAAAAAGLSPAAGARPTSTASSRLSMNTVDIQNFLQIATVLRDSTGSAGAPGTGRTPQPSTAGTAMTAFDVARPAVARLMSTRRTQRTGEMPALQGNTSLSRANSAATAAIAGVPATYSYMAPSDVDAGEDEVYKYEYPMPAAPGLQENSNQRDTGESWGNIVVR